ncbi:hypothetical protein AEGHOMDF_5169 [Methylobacterium soli]|nr:hypothetical protein AEGHOMDF_5169 [Methylobacterium soli]
MVRDPPHPDEAELRDLLLLLSVQERRARRAYGRRAERSAMLGFLDWFRQAAAATWRHRRAKRAILTWMRLRARPVGSVPQIQPERAGRMARMILAGCPAQAQRLRCPVHWARLDNLDWRVPIEAQTCTGCSAPNRGLGQPHGRP